MTSVELPETVWLPLEEIKPYPNNPRRIPPDAVAAVKNSLVRYGYQQPIVVDTDHVIIVGHTRRLALLELGVEQVPVYVARLTPEQANTYRLVDNRTNEGSDWDHSALVMELREFEAGLLEEYFPHVDLEIQTINAALTDVTDADTVKAASKVTEIKEQKLPATTRVICPACYGDFMVKTDSLPGLTRTDLEELEAAANATETAQDAG